MLGRKPFIVNEEWAIIGHTGWYDYSFAAQRFSLDELQKENIMVRLGKIKNEYLGAYQIKIYLK
ncbi:putative phosphoesterase, putative [Staphylococcus aureus]|uniref:Putative phosphoesterase, putative n=1 Tax=Staphylococcus aureus TaxID=1280 RepID=A0A380DSW5_STAAU|nr:putative phosphoesterase, putative [Staphylococcus aureus]